MVKKLETSLQTNCNKIQLNNKKKKKKKNKYNDFIKSIMTSNKNDDKIKKNHKKYLKKNLGGGNFSKIDKI